MGGETGVKEVAFDCGPVAESVVLEALQFVGDYEGDVDETE